MGLHPCISPMMRDFLPLLGCKIEGCTFGTWRRMLILSPFLWILLPFSGYIVARVQQDPLPTTLVRFAGMVQGTFFHRSLLCFLLIVAFRWLY